MRLQILLFCSVCFFRFRRISSFACSPLAEHHGRDRRTRQSYFLARRSPTTENQQQSPSARRRPLLEDILREHGYGRRIISLKPQDLPLIAEVFENGQSTLVSLEAFVAGDEDGSTSKEPKAVVRILFAPKDEDGIEKALSLKTISFGDITTIWHEAVRQGSMSTGEEALLLDAIQRQLDSFKAPRVERAMDRLYGSRVGTARSSTKGISKKQVGEFAQQHFGDDAQQAAWAEAILRQIIKAGVGSSRLVTSDAVRNVLYNVEHDRQWTVTERAVASILVSRDAAGGGRFKRFPCLVVHSEHVNSQVSAITIINGGWLIMDQSVRAGAEGRHFAERHHAGKEVATLADERITRRLECLALGEAFSVDELQVDVRETLKGMNLPVNAKGAMEALVRIGRWSGNEDFSKLTPWSSDILKAASWFVERNNSLNKDKALADGRVDLTMFPCICIDGKGTAFRDDAIGIRPRSLTGRRISPEASKWEILIHVVDCSSVYSQQAGGKGPLACLKGAVESRILSRYDLPRPLHILPPRVLRALSFSPDSDCHCCVTLWAYIDERDGRLLDAGLERSVITAPQCLSFEDASSLVEGSGTNDIKFRSMLLVIERNLSKWRRRQLEENDATQRREARLRKREVEDADAPDYGYDSFARTRGHRMVDSALDLHGSTLYSLLRRSNVPFPATVGADVSRGGRVATAPLRRYVDGMAQCQALAALCNHGRLLTISECRKAGKLANDARNAFARVRARKRK